MSAVCKHLFVGSNMSQFGIHQHENTSSEAIRFYYSKLTRTGKRVETISLKFVHKKLTTNLANKCSGIFDSYSLS